MKYVQHISGQGEKFALVDGEHEREWAISVSTGNVTRFYTLPLSEYRLVELPEVWVDVTRECEVKQSEDWPRIMHKVGKNWSDVRQVHYYRIIKAQVADMPEVKQIVGSRWAFLVEKKETPS